MQTAAHLNYRAPGELLSRNTRGRPRKKEWRQSKAKRKTHSDNCRGSVSIKHSYMSKLHQRLLKRPWKLSSTSRQVGQLATSRALPQNTDKGENISRSTQIVSSTNTPASWKHIQSGYDTSNDQNTGGRWGNDRSGGLLPQLSGLTSTPRLFLGAQAYQLSCQTLLRAKCID